MVLQQCLACNNVMQETQKSCKCGHVFEDAKQIAGKRFSEYRAQLYSRLEKKRIKRIAWENRKPKEMAPQTCSKHKANFVDSVTVIRSSFKPKTRLVSKHFHRRRKSRRTDHPMTDPSPKKTVLPPELVSRLPGALQEINRRLTGQNTIWWTMQLK